MQKRDIINRIMELKKEKDAVILAHNYQNEEIQDIADYVGDSLELSRKATQVDCSVIVFCGVHFMAESAKILNPEKKVLLPVLDAGCPMADMVTAEALREEKEKYPDAVVVCYVNSSAAVKAESHICCTSSNAVKVVKTLPQRRILFVPDRNLANYVAKHVPEKEIIPWAGFCPTHERVNIDDVKAVRGAHPDAELLIHPECPPQVVEMADFVGSTSAILKRARESSSKKFIIGTEMGLMHRMKQENPGKEFILLSDVLICSNMKKIKLEDVLRALERDEHSIEVDEDIRKKATLSLDRMLSVL